MMAMFLKKCLNSMCLLLAEFDDAFTETAFSAGRSGLYRQLGPAGGFVWTRSAVPSRDGTAASNSLNYMGLTTEL